MKEIIEKFYTSFENLDAAGMVSCYHDEITFEDPAFGVLKGEHAKNMWRMLCASQKGKNFRITASGIDFSNQKGKAHWEANYVFSQTGRKVHNIINAEFEFKDGMIFKHTDRFDLYRWSRQALGFKGVMLGWTTFFRKKLNVQTNKLLLQFENRKFENKSI